MTFVTYLEIKIIYFITICYPLLSSDNKFQNGDVTDSQDLARFTF